MMLHDDLGLHNVAELEPAPGGGVFLRRYPAAVRAQLPRELGRMMAQDAAGTEIRFVTAAKCWRLTVTLQPSVLAPNDLNNLDVFIFRGAYLHAHHRLSAGLQHLSVMNIAGGEAFEAVTPATGHACGFAPQVWRVLFGRYAVSYHGLDTFHQPHRAPLPEELPRTRWLAYGSSITNGSNPTLHHLSYIYQAARRVPADVFNQGLSGSCYCEAAVADYFAARDDWHLITLELGVNMRSGFSPEEFQRRVTYLLDALLTRHPGQPVVLLTIFTNAQSPGLVLQPDSPAAVHQRAFDEILRAQIATRQSPHLHLLEGRDLLPDASGLTLDFIHPGDYGHGELGRNLGDRLHALCRH